MPQESLESLSSHLLTLLEEATVLSRTLEERLGGMVVDSTVSLTPGLPDLSAMNPDEARKAASRWLAEAQRYIESGGFWPESASGQRPAGITRDIQFVIERLILRLAEGKSKIWEKSPLVALSQFFRFHEAHIIDTKRGIERPLTTFNTRFARHLAATPMHVHCVDEYGVDTRPPEIKYNAASCGVSSDGKWLLWESRKGWMAARLDGSETVRWASDRGYPGHSFWLRDSHRWVGLVSDLQDGQYVVNRLFIRRTNDASYLREIAVEGLIGGLFVGQTDDDTFLMRHDVHG